MKSQNWLYESVRTFPRERATEKYNRKLYMIDVIPFDSGLSLSPKRDNSDEIC